MKLRNPWSLAAVVVLLLVALVLAACGGASDATTTGGMTSSNNTIPTESISLAKMADLIVANTYFTQTFQCGIDINWPEAALDKLDKVRVEVTVNNYDVVAQVKSGQLLTPPMKFPARVAQKAEVSYCDGLGVPNNIWRVALLIHMDGQMTTRVISPDRILPDMGYWAPIYMTDHSAQDFVDEIDRVCFDAPLLDATNPSIICNRSLVPWLEKASNSTGVDRDQAGCMIQIVQEQPKTVQDVLDILNSNGSPCQKLGKG